MAAVAVAIVGTAGVLVAMLTGVGDAEPTVERAAPPSTVIAAPAPAAPAQKQTNRAAEAPSTAKPKPTTRPKAKPTVRSAADCNRIAARSDMPNSDLRPYLRSLGCDAAADSLLVGSAGPAATRSSAPADPGKAALQACREQLGLTTAQCVDMSRRGLAN